MDETHKLVVSLIRSIRRSSSAMSEARAIDLRARTKPRITANDLARYMISSETAKIGILTDAKYSTPPKRIRYSDVRIALRSALCDPASEKRILAAARSAFEQKADDPSSSDFAQDDASKSLDVLDAFSRIRNQLAGYDYKLPSRSQPRIIVNGVEIAINCDVIIHREYRGVEEIGAMMFRFTKPDEGESDSAASKRKEMGVYAATLVHMQVAANLAGNRTPSYKLCWSADVQSGEVHVAPKNFKMKAANIENACRFITALWEDL
ncbi:hypothetical protein [Rhodomicrobium vannielii]|nr:hypothetical protein [Rhodomicrobium vannielii]